MTALNDISGPPDLARWLNRHCYYDYQLPTPTHGAEYWKLQAAFVESRLFLPFLQRLVCEVVPEMAAEHLDTMQAIPFVWTARNYFSTRPLPTARLRQGMAAALLRVFLGEMAARALVDSSARCGACSVQFVSEPLA